MTGLRKTVRYGGNERHVDVEMGWVVPWNFVGSFLDGEWRPTPASSEVAKSEVESEVVKSDSGHEGEAEDGIDAQTEEDADDAQAE